MRKMPVRVLVGIAGILLVAYGLYLFLIYEAQKSLIFQPKPVPESYEYQYDHIDTAAVSPVIKGQDSLRLSTLLFEHANPKGILVFYHGNADNLADIQEPVERFYRRGYHVLIWDYREYGKTGGALTYENLRRDAMQVARYADSSYALPVIPFGRSLGTALAAHVAAKLQVPEVLLQSPFYSFQALGPHYLKGVPFELLLHFPFNTYRSLKQYKGQIGVIHGQEDFIIPFEQSRMLQDSLRTDRFHLQPSREAGHNTLPFYPTYYIWLDRWLGKPVS
jgi:pimeloyl-ACP methyl ester carboxylesterase